MFINFSNHPSKAWDEEQRKAAEVFGPIVDVPFPAVDPSLDEKAILNLAKDSIKRINEHTTGNDVVMVQGEFTLTYAVIKLLKKTKIIKLLKKTKIKVVSACSERKVQELVDSDGNTTRQSVFTFVRFREYM